MQAFTIKLTDEQASRLQRRGERRGCDNVEEYVQTIITQFVAQMDTETRSIDEEVETKLESLGYL
jgi:predicted transcriptional regulator